MAVATASSLSNTQMPLRQQLKAHSSLLSDDEQKRINEAQPKVKKSFFSFSVPVSQNDKIFFIDNLATMLEAGMPLSLALATLTSEAHSRTMRKALIAIRHMVDNGRQLSEALKDHAEIFSPLFIAVIEVGETGGRLTQVLNQLAETSKKAKALKSKVVSALIYPSLILVAMVAVVIVLMLYVFPQLIAIFNDVHVALPIQTRILIAIVSFVQNFGLYILAAFVIAILLLLTGLRIRRVHYVYHFLLMRIPFIGSVWKEIIIVRVTANLKMLLLSGVPIVEAFLITARTSGNFVYERILKLVAHEIELGTTVHDALSKHAKLFPSLVISMSKVGEDTGRFEEILGKLEKFYDDRVTNVFANLSSIIEPFLLLTIGAAVGFIAVSVIMPIYNLAQAF